jgi:hypothetical protein
VVGCEEPVQADEGKKIGRKTTPKEQERQLDRFSHHPPLSQLVEEVEVGGWAKPPPPTVER